MLNTSITNWQKEIQSNLHRTKIWSGDLAEFYEQIDFLVDHLYHTAEECFEALRCIKERKWWNNKDTATKLFEEGSEERKELGLELADIFIQWNISRLYGGFTDEEMQAIIMEKMQLNDPRNSESTIGNRS